MNNYVPQKKILQKQSTHANHQIYTCIDPDIFWQKSGDKHLEGEVGTPPV